MTVFIALLLIVAVVVFFKRDAIPWGPVALGAVLTVLLMGTGLGEHMTDGIDYLGNAAETGIRDLWHLATK